MYYAVFTQKIENGKWAFHSISESRAEATSSIRMYNENFFNYKIVSVSSKDNVDKELEFFNSSYESYAKFALYANKKQGWSHLGVYPDMDKACRTAAKAMAKLYDLPNGKYHLQWGNIILKDAEGMTRIYESNGGDFRIIALQY